MAQLQFQQWNQWLGGIDDSGASPGSHYFSHGIDPYRKPGYLAVADSAGEDRSNNDDADFNDAIYWFVELDGDIFALSSTAEIWKKDSSSGWINDATWQHADGNSGTGQGMIVFNGDIFWASNTTVGQIDTPTATPAFTDSWQTGLTNATWHPMAVFLAKMYVGHGRNIASWDTTTWNATDLILPVGYVAKCMAVIGDFLAIGTIAPEGSDARIFFWDGTSTTYNSVVKVNAASVDAMMTWNNTLWVVAGKAANLHYYDGANLQEIAKMADVDTQSGASVSVYPGGISHFRGRVMLAVNTISALGDRVMAGTWAFDPKTGGFTLAYLPSTGVMNTSGNAWSCYNDGTDLYIGCTDTNTGAASAAFVDKTGGSKYTESAYWISPWFDLSPFANKHFRRFYINFSEFPGSGSNNEVTVKYKVDDTTKRRNNGSEYTATAGAASTVTVADASAIQVGDELTVTGGPSSGDIRRVTANASNVLTVDRAFSATPVNAQTKFVIEPWVEIGTTNVTDDADAVFDGFDLTGVVGKKIQFKIELRDAETTGEEVSISDMSLSFIQKRPF